MADFPTDLSAFADPNHPSHGLYLAFTDFIKDNAGVFAAALAANAVDTTSRMLLASPSVQRTIAGIPGPLGALTSMFSRLTMGGDTSNTSTTAALMPSGGDAVSSTTELAEAHSGGAEIQKLKTYKNSDYIQDGKLNKGAVEIEGQSREAKALQSVFSPESLVTFGVSNLGTTYEVGFDKDIALVEYYSTYWDINMDDLKEDSVERMKVATKKYLDWKYKNPNIEDWVFEHNKDVFRAELTKFCLVHEWKHFVLAAISNLETSVTANVIDSITSIIRMYTGDATRVTPRSQSNGIQITTFSDAIQSSEELKKYTDELTAGGWDVDAIKTTEPYEVYKMTGVQVIGPFFKHVRKSFTSSGEALIEVYHRVFYNLGNVASHALFPLFKQVVEGMVQKFPTKEIFQTAYKKFVDPDTGDISDYKESELHAVLREGIGIIKELTANGQQLVGRSFALTHSQVRQFLKGAFLYNCNEESRKTSFGGLAATIGNKLADLGKAITFQTDMCDLEESFYDFYMTLGLMDELHNSRGYQHAARIFKARLDEIEESQKESWGDWFYDGLSWAGILAVLAYLSQMPGTAAFLSVLLSSTANWMQGRGNYNAISRQNDANTDRILGALSEMNRRLEAVEGASSRNTLDAVSVRAISAAVNNRELLRETVSAFDDIEAQARDDQVLAYEPIMEGATAQQLPQGIGSHRSQVNDSAAAAANQIPRTQRITRITEQDERNTGQTTSAPPPADIPGGSGLSRQNEDFLRQPVTLPGESVLQNQAIMQGQLSSGQPGPPNTVSTASSAELRQRKQKEKERERLERQKRYIASLKQKVGRR